MPKPAEKKTKETYRIHLEGLLLLSLSLLLTLALYSFGRHAPEEHALGYLGFVGGSLFHYLFGLASYLIPFFLGLMGVRLLIKDPPHYVKVKLACSFFIVISSAMLLAVAEDYSSNFTLMVEKTFYPVWVQRKVLYHLGGAPLYYLYKELPGLNLKHLINTTGVVLLFSTLLVGSLAYLLEVPLGVVLQKIASRMRSLFTRKKRENSPIVDEEGTPDFMRYVKLRIQEPPQNSPSETKSSSSSPKQEYLAIKPDQDLTSRPSFSRKSGNEPPAEKKKEGEKKSLSLPAPALTLNRQLNPLLQSTYTLPPLSLLTPAKKQDQTHLKKDLKKQAEVLEETLQSFGIEAKVGQINCGPTITSFEVHPSIGVKVQRIKALENDIALNMEAKSIRIIAPIPGKAAVGIEVPNLYPQEVGFKEMLATYQQGSQRFKVPVLLGKAVNGDYVLTDLAKMPHCIIAGATGSGKSVCINTIVMAIVFNARPDEVRLLMVDPKKVELTPYSKLPHMIAPVITEPHGAANALMWLVREMEKRYEILRQVGVRNIDGFNNRQIDKAMEDALTIEVPEKMPYIIGIIDELADLMMVSASDIETPIARIAQMARAVGIHLILATQRPSREVITGLIKANFPTRISFKVASRVNSQIVLDDIGAESLLGNGDLLFLPPGSSQLLRAQGAFIRDEDINRVIDYLCGMAPTNYLIPSFDTMDRLDGPLSKEIEESSDTLYNEALEIVKSTNNASTTFLQRKLKIGYARAASLMDLLEAKGVVSAANGAKPRRVLTGGNPNNDIDTTEEDLNATE